MKKNLCVVELKGGFGNQLFQYCFAYKLRTKGFRVKVSNTFFTTKETNVNVTLEKRFYLQMCLVLIR